MQKPNILATLILLTLPTITTATSLTTPISRFQEYLKINTSQPTPNYKESTSFILSLAKSLSLESKTIEFTENKPVIILKWAGSDPELKSVLLNSHADVVPAESEKWKFDPFGGEIDEKGRIYGRGAQDMKCVGMQYLEGIKKLMEKGWKPLRNVYVSFVPDEEIVDHHGAGLFSESELFQEMNVGVVLDEGLASPDEHYRAFYAERVASWLVIKAKGAPGHGAKLYDNTAMENLLTSIESIWRFRASQFDLVKAGLKAENEVFSVNMAYLKSGIKTPTGFIMNLQPSEAEAGIDLRFPPTADAESFERRIAEEWAPASRNMTFEIFPAATDARYFRKRGLLAIGFSPMANTPILLHDHNEFLNQAEYLKGIDVYESIIKTFTSYVGPEGVSKDEL